MYPYSLNFDDEISENVETEQLNRPPFPNHGNNPFKPDFDGNQRPSPHHPHNSKPKNPPPHHIPQRKPKTPGVYAIDPGAIRGCQNDITYIWLENGRSFWMYITFVGRQSVSGYRWSQFGWTYTGIDLRSVESFSCSKF